MSLRTVSLLAWLLFGAAPLARAQKHCLPYGPINVTLSGKLERHATTAPASETAAADAGGEVLMLPTPVCVAASPSGPAPPHEDVRRLRLALSKDQAAHLEEEGAGQIVRVTGMLSEAAGGEDSPNLRLTVIGIDSD
ncbi:hypothetical protein [Xanthomonas cerealis]|uniref:DUF4431 domain-containing protein n=1 Tax=Xanthomonas cerealis pv. cerealis TaxID=152263 RepID=A0A514EGM0_9XANT|nr:hypothetical protein [Xanthomonas translucens]QDI05197.1 hypothetical protein E4A48_17220 [Xanthomonas translucens pv. cerealis]UKE47240.1 hypothetical protein KHA79_00260 [Xanthomonas translucens pv. cerealis]UKE69579.1 hypothetical protein K8O61_00240 [Xanthomonas translucens pv. pistacia]